MLKLPRREPNPNFGTKTPKACQGERIPFSILHSLLAPRDERSISACTHSPLHLHLHLAPSRCLASHASLHLHPVFHPSVRRLCTVDGSTSPAPLPSFLPPAVPKDHPPFTPTDLLTPSAYHSNTPGPTDNIDETPLAALLVHRRLRNH